jgi:SsrA-binding protein
MGLHISPYSHTRIEYQAPTRERKLLLNKQEITRLSRKVQDKGYSLLPLKIYFKRGWAKVEIGLGKGKKLYDKREDIKAKDLKREMARSDKYD